MPRSSQQIALRPSRATKNEERTTKNEWTVDPASETPLHRQVYDAIRVSILSGSLSPGDRLPATRALAGRLALSRTTIAEAYDQLQAEGYVQGKHGSGTYVASEIRSSSVANRDSSLSAIRAVQRRTNGRLPNTSYAQLRLSRWGKRISGSEYEALVRPANAAAFRFDFRPHRIARDRFPWDAWRASVDRALTADRSSMMSYPPSAGHPGLREAISAHVARYRSVACSPDQIVIVNGTQQGLNLLAELVLESGDRIAVEDPGYPTARLTFAARGMSVSRIPVDEEGLVVERFADAGPHRMVHVTPSHQDPTGTTLTLARRLALLEVAERTGCLIVEDDYDSEFRYEGRPVESLQGLDRSGLVAYAGTFSKSILPGLRVGFMILPPALVSPLIAAKSLWDGGAPILEQATLAQFMVSGEMERHIRRMRRLYRRRRDSLVAALDGAFGSRVWMGERHGGLNMLVVFDAPVSDAEMAKKAGAVGIGLRPASPYFSIPPSRPTFLMGFAELSEDEIVNGVRALAEVLV
jgi:GntR family transcriptional regulator / MocR family aminotransferase